jgi:hypothetical protein
MELKDVTLAKLEGNFVLTSYPTDAGNVYVEGGHLQLGFGVKNGDVYQIDFSDEEIADPTKGKLVVTLDASNKKIYWLQAHLEQQPYDTYNSLRESTFAGDAGYPLLEALDQYIKGTYNSTGYDTRLVTMGELASGVMSANGGSNANPKIEDPTGVAAVATDDGAKVTAK